MSRFLHQDCFFLSEWIGREVERENGLERLLLIGWFSLHLNLELRLDTMGSISVVLLGGDGEKERHTYPTDKPQHSRAQHRWLPRRRSPMKAAVIPSIMTCFFFYFSILPPRGNKDCK